MLRAGLIDGADFDLDFHAIMHWGEDAALEKHYVPSRAQRTRSVLTFVAQDAATHNLVFANADISKATQAREVIAFCEHWRSLTGTDPGLLVFDQKLTTQAVLAELDERGITFMTLRMRSPALIRHIEQLDAKAFKHGAARPRRELPHTARRRRDRAPVRLPQTDPPARRRRPRPRKPDRADHQPHHRHREVPDRTLRPPSSATPQPCMPLGSPTWIVSPMR